MGGHSNHGEPIQWPEEIEKFLLELLAEWLHLDPNGIPCDKIAAWEEIDELIFINYGVRYGVEKLKAKHHRMRLVHAKFTELITNIGVTWDASRNIVSADNAVWDGFFKRDKIYKTFKRKGCKLYTMLNQVYGSSSATGAFPKASTSAPQKYEEEQRIEQEYPSVGSGGGDEDVVGEGNSRGKRNSEGHLECLPGNRRVKRNTSRGDEVDALMHAFSQSVAALMGAFSQTVASVTKEFSIRDCMAALDDIPNVSTTLYNKAIGFFVDPNWRKIFFAHV